jgi:hypothetical protein
MVFELLGELDELAVQGRDRPDQGQDGRSVGSATMVGAWSWGARRAACSCTALAWAPRWRPARTRAAARVAREGCRPRVGVGAIWSTARASRLPTWVPKAASDPGRTPQQAAELVDLPSAGPDQALVGAGQDLDRLGQLAVAGDGAVVVPVGPDQVGQDLGVPGIGLGARDGVAVAVAAGGQRADRIHLIAGRDQRAQEQAAVGLGPDHDLGRVGDQASQQLMQRGQPGQPLSHPPGRHDPAALVHDGHIMVGLGPVQPDKQHPSSSPGSTSRSSLRKPATP